MTLQLQKFKKKKGIKKKRITQDCISQTPEKQSDISVEDTVVKMGDEII